jgi:hypothetical protein
MRCFEFTPSHAFRISARRNEVKEVKEVKKVKEVKEVKD